MKGGSPASSAPNTSSVDTWWKRNAALRAGSSPDQYTRAASSSTKVPTTLVCTNGPGPSIERSTWVSAARCITASGWWVANTSAMAAASVMSARTSVWRGCPCASSSASSDAA